MWEGFPLQLLQSVKSFSGTMWGSIVVKNQRIHQVGTFPSQRSSQMNSEVIAVISSIHCLFLRNVVREDDACGVIGGNHHELH